MDSVMDASSWPALSIQRVPSPEVILSTEIATCEPVPTEMAGANKNECLSSSSAIDSTVSVSVDDSAPRSEHSTVTSSSSSPSSMGPRSQSSSQYNYGANRIHHQHYHSDGFRRNQRANGFNSKGGKRGGYVLPNHNFSTTGHQQQQSSHWNHNRGGFNCNTNARWVNSRQQIHHGFINGSSEFLGPRRSLIHSFLHSTPMINSPYFNVNHQPPPPPIPGYMFPYYGNANYSEVSNPWYCPPVSLPSVPSPPPYIDAISGALTYNQPIFPNSEVGMCNKILYQIEYYFSKENLEKDGYMKSLMDDEGWIPVHRIAGFRRVKAMTSDINLILRSLQLSAVVEVQGNKMRRRGDWMNWVQNRSTDAQISSITDISTGIQNIHLRESWS
ncbi:la-related protein 1B-like [Macadamia integrifolia]|uniref:la-related protein 1B-like n=1 Tax=Macadamia integrifolia TaxID=60698 RepID=UPI001C4EE9D1|nr:la-related protein 1B-like [Macadamia integrifolia]